MKRYIKINSDNYIIDIFHELQTEKFDGTEIYFDDNAPSVWIAEVESRNKGLMSQTLGVMIDCRKKDVDQVKVYISAIEAGAVPAGSVFYKSKNNDKIKCTLDQVKAALLEVEINLLQMSNLQDNLKSEITAADTIEEVEAITWNW